MLAYAAGLARASRRGGSGTGACQAGARSVGVKVPETLALPFPASDAGTGLPSVFSADADFS